MDDDYQLKVVLQDGEGKILAAQDYYDYQYGERDNKISILYYGRKLADILIEQTGTITFRNNIPALSFVLDVDPQKSSMRLLGRVAEAVIVRRCNENEKLNWRYFNVARMYGSWRKTAKRFKAIGTGLLSTSSHYPKQYNPGDTQRDIVWIDEDEHVALMKGSSRMSGIQAGLQIKVSTLGYNYIYNDLLVHRYEVPLVYFPLRNDFDRLANDLYKNRVQIYDNELKHTRPIEIGKDFINIRTIDPEAFDEVRSYEKMCFALMNGNLSAEELVYTAYHSGDVQLQNAILDTTLIIKTPDIIVAR